MSAWVQLNQRVSDLLKLRPIQHRIVTPIIWLEYHEWINLLADPYFARIAVPGMIAFTERGVTVRLVGK